MSFSKPTSLKAGALGLLAGVTALISGGGYASGAPGTAWNTTIVIQNLANSATNAVISYYSTTGVLMKAFPVNGIAPKATAYVDSQLVGEIPGNFAGNAVVSSSQPVAVAFIGADAATPATRNHQVGSGAAAGSTTSYLPDVSNGYADKQTTVIVQNAQSAPTNVTVTFIERFSGTGTAVLRQTIAPNAAHYYDLGNLPARVTLPFGWTGSAIVQTDGPPVVAMAQQRSLTADQANLYPGVQPSTQAYLPEVFYDFTGNRMSSFIRVQNVTNADVSVRATYYNDGGQGLAAQDIVLGPLQSQVLVPAAAGLPQGLRGAALLQASGQVAVVARHSSALSDLDMMYTAPDPASLRMALPFVQWAPANAPGGYRSTVSVMNTTAAPITVTVRYYDQNGVLRHAPTATIPLNGVFRSDPNPFVGEAFFMGSVEVEAQGSVAVVADSMTLDGARGEAYPAVRTQ